MKPYIALSSPECSTSCRTNTGQCTQRACPPLQSLRRRRLPGIWTSCLLVGLSGLGLLPHYHTSATSGGRPAVARGFVAACSFTILMSAAASSMMTAAHEELICYSWSAKTVAPLWRPSAPDADPWLSADFVPLLSLSRAPLRLHLSRSSSR